MNSRDRFHAALRGAPLDRPPVWIMRQAGRYLPEYRALKEQYDFLTLAQTPELACEVTLQPLRRYALDAAILFSDILIVPEAMGQPYHFREQGGIGMDYRLEHPAQIAALDSSAVPEKLAYVGEALRLIAREVGGEKMLLGFGGSPWTLATYMIEGGSSAHFTRAKALYFEEPTQFEQLMEKLVEALVLLFRMQIEAGAEAIQIFDSWAAACPGAHYEAMSLRWIREIIARLPEGFPVILFAKGMTGHLPALLATGAQAFSIDAQVDLAHLRAEVPANFALQGNLDNSLLELAPEVVRAEATRLLESLRGQPGHIVNLGHGITPQARLESVAALIETVTAFH
ncbi:MAG: uroporphyrinogen decarboxylase [Verrucomicrobiota bacterium]